MSQFQLKTKYYFGKEVVNKYLLTELKNYKPKKIYLVYGGGSIKKNGIYDTITKILKQSKITFVEHSGIKANPMDSDTTAAIKKGREKKVDFIIAVGGGSVIDASKVMATAIPNNNFKTAWDVMEKPFAGKNKPLNIFSIVTLAATGSENNNGAVITNDKTYDKWSKDTPAIPCVCFEDPTYTFTVNKWQTGSGTFDIFSHLLEQYFELKYDFKWTKNYLIGCMKTVLQNAKAVMKYPYDYNSRSNLLWTSSFALNALSSAHTSGGDWKVHIMERAISGRFDISHGAGLALITPTYLEYMSENDKKYKELIIELGQELFGVDNVTKCIKNIKKLIKTLKMPTKFSDFKEIGKITEEDINFLAKLVERDLPGSYKLALNIYNRIPK